MACSAAVGLSPKENIMSIDLTKVAVGTFANLGGQPVDYAISAVLDRAGVPQDDDARKGLVYTHASSQGKAVPRLPEPFPPVLLPDAQRLETAQDYLSLIAATPPEFVATPAEARAAEEEARVAAVQAETAEKEAAEKEAAEKEAAATNIQQSVPVQQTETVLQAT